MTMHFHLPHPSESLRTLLVVAITFALLLVLFCAAPAGSQIALAGKRGTGTLYLLDKECLSPYFPDATCPAVE